ncbi:MAG: hypothetical protein HZB39_17695 [Planctomycetes bacterium]|nr:hypothetical protein [Planctomycetota bacterium]
MFADLLTSDLIAVVAAWLWTFAVHGTVIVASVSLVACLVRRSASREEPLWRYALVAGFVTSALQVWLLPASIAPLTFEFGPTVDVPSFDAARGLVLEPADLASRAPTASALPSGMSRDWVRLGVQGAIVLAALGLAALGRRRIRLIAWLRGRRAVPADHPLRRELDALRARMGIRRAVRLTASDALASPVAFGVLRLEVCVPSRALTESSGDVATAMLAHELAHMARRDPLWLDLANTVRAVFPWQPMFAIAASRLRTLAERRCDAIAARIAGPVAVAECLVTVAGWIGDRRLGAPREIPAMAVERDGLRNRVERLLGDEWRERREPSPIALACATVAATAMFAVALPSAEVQTLVQPGVEHGVATTSEPAFTVPPEVANRFPRLASLLELCDAEQRALRERVAVLSARAVELDDAELDSMLTVVDARLAELDAIRARIMARAVVLSVSPAAAPASATSVPEGSR